jgi:hypothetical protein
MAAVAVKGSHRFGVSHLLGVLVAMTLIIYSVRQNALQPFISVPVRIRWTEYGRLAGRNNYEFGFRVDVFVITGIIPG